jgi:ribosomal-protein-alanine N-acetyltransferase
MQIALPLEHGVLLREFEADDAATACATEFDPVVKRYLKVPDKSEAEWVESFKSQIGSLASFAVVALPERVLAGRASIDGDLLHDVAREMEIVIDRPFWGRGIGRLVADVLLREAFQSLRASEVTATVHPDNAPSLKLLRTFRFQQVGCKDVGWQKGHLRFQLKRGA